MTQRTWTPEDLAVYRDTAVRLHVLRAYGPTEVTE